MIKIGVRPVLAIIFSVICFQAMSAYSAEQNIYIDANFGQGGNGSYDSPFNEFTDINWESGGEKSVADAVSAGDDVKIRLKRGTSWNERLKVYQSGTQAHPIFIGPYGTGDLPVIDGGDALSCIVVEGRRYITINGIDMRNSGPTTLLRLRNCDNIIVSGCRFAGAQMGISIVAQDRIDSHDIVIESCEFTALTLNGIRAQVDGWGGELGTGDGTIYGLHIVGNIFDELETAVNVLGDEVTLTSHGDISPYEITIADNVISNTERAAIILWGLRDVGSGSFIQNNTLTNIGDSDEPNVNAIQLHWIKRLTIEDNLIDTVRTSKTDGCAIIIDFAWYNDSYFSTNVIVRRNIIKNCNALGKGKGIGVWKGKDTLIYSNLIVNCSKGIKIANIESKGTICYNNTIAGSEDGIAILNSGGGTSLHNNIVFNSSRYGILILNSDISVSDYNCVYGSAVENFRGIAVKGNNSIETNPMFQNVANANFQLSVNSPCVDGGVNASFITSDILGNSVPVNVTTDMGVYEYSGSETNNVPSKVQNFRLTG